MIKLVTLLHRRPDLTREAFIERYEHGHRLIGEKHLRSFACRYVRRYCHSPGGGRLATSEPPADVVMEIWFPDQAAFDAAMTHLAQSDVQAEIVADEERLFDRDKMVSFVVEEYESDMPMNIKQGEHHA